MIQPHVHVPYHQIADYLQILKENRINLELYFSSHILDTINTSDISRLLKRLEYRHLLLYMHLLWISHQVLLTQK